MNETFIRQQADRLISSGLAGAGYEYIIVDGEASPLQYSSSCHQQRRFFRLAFPADMWSALNRTSDGRLQANSTTFPSGMKALGDYLHDNGAARHL